SDSFGVISIPLASYLSLWRHIYSFIFPSWSPPSSIRKRYETFPKNQSQSLVDSSPVAKARRVHNEALRSKTGYYIQNHLPIRLLQLSDM
ncbi:hypothetical protein FS842_004669, partial [Serendipita sp. 407]